MAQVTSNGLTALRRDLRAIDKRLVVELRGVLKDAAQPTLAEAARRAPRGTRPIPAGRKTVTGARSRKRLHQSLRINVRGVRVLIRSNLAYAGIVHYGGRRPVNADRSKWVRVPARPFIAQAAEAQADHTVDRLADGVERLVLKHGFK